MRQLLPIPNYRDGMTSVFDRMMRRLENEANDKKRLEKQYSTSLRGTEAEKQMIEIRLRSKDKELNRINESFYGNRVITSYFITIFSNSDQLYICFFFKDKIYTLKKEKALLERKLENEVMNTNRLRRQVDNLKLTIQGLSQNIDHLQSEHSKNVRNTMRRQYSNLYREV